MFDICNLDLIYNREYEYSLPRSILEGYLSGKAFDYNTEYTKEELDALKRDVNEIFQRIISTVVPQGKPLAIITAGAPGAGKTTLLKEDLKGKERQFAYVDPDDVCLKQMTSTYVADITKDSSVEGRKAAYKKWRPGSNAAAQLIMAHLVKQKISFYFGATSTHPSTGKLFAFLNSQGYNIRLLHVSAPDDVRWKSVLERDKTFIQTTEEDVRQKGELLPQRIRDTYLKYSRQIDFYYRDQVNAKAVKTATWSKNDDGSCHLRIIDIGVYSRIKDLHDQALKPSLLNALLPSLAWENTVEEGVTKALDCI